jgi:hypothetical protein
MLKTSHISWASNIKCQIDRSLLVEFMVPSQTRHKENQMLQDIFSPTSSHYCNMPIFSEKQARQQLCHWVDFFSQATEKRKVQLASDKIIRMQKPGLLS